jgi:hypothetical protein
LPPVEPSLTIDYNVSMAKNKVVKVEKTKHPQKANKRTRDEVLMHREHLADWVAQGYTHREMADLLYEKFGVRISAEQVRYDINKVRDQWRKNTIENYQTYVNEELSWLASYERALWKDYRASKNGLTAKRIERVITEMEEALDAGFDGEDAGLVVARVVETMADSHGDTRFLELIFKARQERRKLLGLYAPHLVGIKVEKTETINVKGYADVVSPSLWPDANDAVEGEVLQITDGSRNKAG